MKWHVHVYTPYRVKYAVEADTPEAAGRIALDLLPDADETIEVEHADGMPALGLLVDELTEAGEHVDDGEGQFDDGGGIGFDLVWRVPEGEPRPRLVEPDAGPEPDLPVLLAAARAALTYLEDDCEPHWSAEQRAVVDDLRAALGRLTTCRRCDRSFARYPVGCTDMACPHLSEMEAEDSD